MSEVEHILHLRDGLNHILGFLGSLKLDFDGEIWLYMALMVSFGMFVVMKMAPKTNIMLD